MDKKRAAGRDWRAGESASFIVVRRVDVSEKVIECISGGPSPRSSLPAHFTHEIAPAFNPIGRHFDPLVQISSYFDGFFASDVLLI